jgi:hypothetical protein
VAPAPSRVGIGIAEGSGRQGGSTAVNRDDATWTLAEATASASKCITLWNSTPTVCAVPHNQIAIGRDACSPEGLKLPSL